MSLVVGDTLLFDTADDSLWAHDTSNGTTWRVMQHTGTNAGEGTHETVVGTGVFKRRTLLVEQNWAFDAETGQAFRAADIVPGSDGNPGQNMMVGLSGVVYFDASTHSRGVNCGPTTRQMARHELVADIAYDDPDGRPFLEHCS